MRLFNFGVPVACVAGIGMAAFAAFSAFSPLGTVNEAEASGVIVFPKQDQLVEASGFGSYITVERVDNDRRESTLVRIAADPVSL
jgi:hypothetical protein